jgi:hypothetical protein
MNPPPSFQIELVKLADGTRWLRVADPVSGTTLERRVRENEPVARQKSAVLQALGAVLDRELKEAVAD